MHGETVVDCDFCGDMMAGRLIVEIGGICVCPACANQIEREVEEFLDSVEAELTEADVEAEWAVSTGVGGGASQANEWLIIDPC